MSRSTRDRRSGRGDAVLAVGEALRDRQAPAFEEGGIQCEGAMAIEPARSLSASPAEHDQLAAQIVVGGDQPGEIVGAPAGPPTQTSGMSAGSASLRRLHSW